MENMREALLPELVFKKVLKQVIVCRYVTARYIAPDGLDVLSWKTSSPSGAM
jgi:hypothetical protein